MNKGKIIYTGAFRFPDKDAASQRVLGIGESLRQSGLDIIFCGWEQIPREEDKVNNIYVYKGFPYYSQKELDLITLNKLNRLFRFVFKGRKTIKWINQYINKEKVNYIIVYNANVYFLIFLYFLCKKKGIKLVVDCTEWYQGKHLPGGKYGLANLDNILRIKFIYPILKNIILISSFLENYYIKKKCKVLVVPPLIDINDSKWKIRKYSNDFPDKIQIIYAGNPGKKDILDTIFSATYKFNQKDGKNIEIHLIGIDEQECNKFYFYNKNVPSYIKCHGKVPLKDVPSFYSDADFSFICRENLHYANAGFPTKLVESLACGVPVICNITSDIGKYITDGIDSFILEDISESAILTCFEKINKIDAKEYFAMKNNAKKCAITNFHYENYSKILAEFIDNL